MGDEVDEYGFPLLGGKSFSYWMDKYPGSKEPDITEEQLMQFEWYRKLKKTKPGEGERILIFSGSLES